MVENSVPAIFSEPRRIARVRRAAVRQHVCGAPARFLLDDMAEDMVERLRFVRHLPRRALIIGDTAPTLLAFLEQSGSDVTLALDADPVLPQLSPGFDFIGVLGQLDAVNDLPGALIRLRAALVPNGYVIASFIGGQSVPVLRDAILAAEPDRPAARIHPLVDARAAPSLLQRAEWKDPVVDTHTLLVRYARFSQLIDDLRDQGLGSALARPAPALSRAALARAQAAFAAHAEADGKVTERFEIVTLTGRRSLAGT